MSGRTVAVIGAGSAGLVTARELLKEGHVVTVFEQSDTVGGVWKYSEEVENDLLGLDPDRERVHSSLYASVRTNLPREIMSFSDWPFTPEAMQGRSVDKRRFCRHEEVQAYLELFAEEFAILPHIQFQRRVIAAVPLPHNGSARSSRSGSIDSAPRWKLTTASTVGGLKEDLQQQEFDAVVCCVGTYFQPNVPHIPGLATFPGRQLHCHNYRSSKSFLGETVLVAGASFSGDEIARLIANVADTVFHTARIWPKQEYHQPRSNLHRLPWVTHLEPTGEAVFADGSRHKVDSIVYCTGYQYSFPFLEETHLISTDEGHVHPLYKHIFVPCVPSLAFVGLLWKSLRFPQFELQGKLVARFFSGRVSLPNQAAMEEDLTGFYKLLQKKGVPMRYVHNQHDSMPVNQWRYNDSLAEMCGPDVPLLPHWRRDLHSILSDSIFGRPETFRDEWTEQESAAFDLAAQACNQLLLEYNARRKERIQGMANGKHVGNGYADRHWVY